MKTEFKGTKGNWNIHQDNEIGILIGGYNPFSEVCTVHRYGNKIEENANVKLISKAPEMLAMLIKLRDKDEFEIEDHLDLTDLINEIID